MIQRVLGAKNMYHARMGIVLAGYMKILLPAIVVLPGLILFARFPEVMRLPWQEVRPEADKGYVTMLQMLVPIGLRGLFLAALFGAIQSTVSSVLNSTSTIFTLDIYKRLFYKNASEKHLVFMGRMSSVAIMIIAIVLGGFISKLGGSLFVYIQSLYAFFAPPFAAIFLLGLGVARLTATHSTTQNTQLTAACIWLEPFQMQAAVNWVFCVVLCVAVSLATPKPSPEQVTDELTLNWKKINIFQELGSRWYTHVALWWGIFALIIILLILIFSGLYL